MADAEQDVAGRRVGRESWRGKVARRRESERRRRGIEGRPRVCARLWVGYVSGIERRIGAGWSRAGNRHDVVRRRALFEDWLVARPASSCDKWREREKKVKREKNKIELEVRARRFVCGSGTQPSGGRAERRGVRHGRCRKRTAVSVGATRKRAAVRALKNEPR